MKIANDVHARREWRVHALARDFTLLDVWRVPVELDPRRGETFQDFFSLVVRNGFETDSRAAAALFRLRFWLGRAFRLDRTDPRACIPGCAEASVAERLSPEERAAQALVDAPAPRLPVEARVVYVLDGEALLEVVNRTIHALIHVGRVGAGNGLDTIELAIYVKSRGWFSDAYMALIRPFRHAIVYPAWIRRLCSLWEERRGARDQAACLPTDLSESAAALRSFPRPRT